MISSVKQKPVPNEALPSPTHRRTQMAQLSGPTEEDLSVYLAGFGIVAMEEIILVTQDRAFAPIASPEGSFEVQEALQ